MATYLDDSAIKSYYSAIIGQSDESSIGPRFDLLVPLANQSAYNEIRAKLAGRGFTAAQIAAWDRGEEYNRDLAICFLLRSALAGTVAEETRQTFCVRAKELEDVDITNDGEIVQPSIAGGAIGYGDMTRDDDVFSTETVW